MGGAASCGAVGGGGVAAVAVDPEKLTSEIENDSDWDQWGSLVYFCEVLECGGVFFKWENQSFGSE